jgi:hypothetical protein
MRAKNNPRNKVASNDEVFKICPFKKKHNPTKIQINLFPVWMLVVVKLSLNPKHYSGDIHVHLIYDMSPAVVRRGFF